MTPPAGVRQGGPEISVLAAPAYSTRHANPYNAILYDGLRDRGVRVDEYSLLRLLGRPPHVVHVHWPELLFLSAGSAWRVLLRVLLFGAALRLARWRRGTVLVWTVHNAAPHEGGTASPHRWFWRWFTSRVDGFLVLTGAGAVAARASYPALRTRPWWVTPHVDYRSTLAGAPTQSGARDALGLPRESRVVLCIGQVRRYKGVSRLVDAWTSLARDERAGAHLVVAGRPESPELAEELAARAPEGGDLHLDLRLLPPEVVTQYLAASDLVVLPHTAVLNSGAALLALSADRPVLAPALGALPELQQAVGPAWVRTYEAPLDPEDLAAVLRWIEGRDVTPPDLRAFAVPEVARATEEAFRSVVSSRRRSTGLRGAAAVLVSLVVAGCSAGQPSPSPTGSAETSGADAVPVPTVQEPLVALGDSISLGLNACGGRGRCLEASWATGTDATSIAGRLLGRDPEPGEVETLAAEGAKATDLPGQARRAAADRAAVVTVLVGANDLCAAGARTTDPALFEESVETALDELAAAEPAPLVLLASVPDLTDLAPVGAAGAAAADTCPALLRPVSGGAGSGLGEERFAELVDEYNSALAAVCAEHELCRWDGGAVFDTDFSDEDLSRVDHFHPSIVGQNRIADAAWSGWFG